MFFPVFTFFLFSFFFFLSIPFQKLIKAAIKRHSATCICFQFDKLYKIMFLATFVNTQETFQRGLNVVVRVIWRRDVGEYQINAETTLCMSTLIFTTFNKVKSTFSISTLISTTLNNVERMLLFSKSSVTKLWIWPFSKSWKEQKNIFEL